MNKKVRTNIIPAQHEFAKIPEKHELHLKAICVFSAIGFFLNRDTYWKDKIVLPGASNNTLTAEGVLVDSTPYFNWHYTPRSISFNQALDKYIDVFETIVKEQTEGKQVILPLSGGLDSRTQALALKRCNAKVKSYSYDFKGGFKESKIAEQIANACDFEFQKYQIQKGYLWNCIDTLSELNHCFSDFTAPRQMAVYDQFDTMGDVFSLGHWGDVLFDSMNISNCSETEELQIIKTKLIKRGGMEIASRLWDVWGLQGTFDAYFTSRLSELLNNIKIDNSNAKLRAFKSMYWAPRWTSVNLSVFQSKHPIRLPYYDNRMCEFICEIPEDYLKNRKLQIAYIRSKSPKLANITWQDQRPFHLNNYQYNKYPYNVPYRGLNKLKRMFNGLTGKPYIQRNWELQFCGAENMSELESRLRNTSFNSWIPEQVITTYINAFKNGQQLENAHALNMLLVLSQFDKHTNE
ncbi:asparagine synthase-related protein [uncultured Psychroserpens sp.]|uniref:asparagine synthase-related protein n=1 Tax=uncultured Psychroserpens sp. TaxID=255436 RepID=UPI002614CF26|nr:asparagine synthase-related protein [uncultured Psychroserpens sp.]